MNGGDDSILFHNGEEQMEKKKNLSVILLVIRKNFARFVTSSYYYVYCDYAATVWYESKVYCTVLRHHLVSAWYLHSYVLWVPGSLPLNSTVGLNWFSFVPLLCVARCVVRIFLFAFFLGTRSVLYWTSKYWTSTCELFLRFGNR